MYSPESYNLISPILLKVFFSSVYFICLRVFGFFVSGKRCRDIVDNSLDSQSKGKGSIQTEHLSLLARRLSILATLHAVYIGTWQLLG